MTRNTTSSVAQNSLDDGTDLSNPLAETLVLPTDQAHPDIKTQPVNDDKPSDTSLTKCIDRIGIIDPETIASSHVVKASLSAQSDNDSLRQHEWKENLDFQPLSSNVQQEHIGEHKPPIRSRFGFLLDEDVSAMTGMDLHQNANLYQQACIAENEPGLPAQYTSMGFGHLFPSMRDSLVQTDGFSCISMDKSSSSMPIPGPVIHSGAASVNDWPFWSPRPLEGHELMGVFVPKSSMQYGSRFVDFPNEQCKQEYPWIV